ncbi:MAG: prepilin-type N-terminal cleavage/methylation domain-containing protein [Candidatus Sericytochromatia bacterium]|nr:prepilin-type N-terminal cleavage/methylation domain-containing protein [Candidatus Sericytochromatia bacterium]
MQHKRQTQQGFTVVELMTVVVILGILVAIGSVNLIGAQVRAKEAATRTNMHQLQSAVAIYAVDYNGTYPARIEALNEDPVTNLNKMQNPFDRKTGLGAAYDNEDSAQKPAGLITLEITQEDDKPVYRIFGYTSKAQRIQQQERPFILSNA